MCCSRDDQGCIDSGVEMNGDSSISNGTSECSTIDTIDLSAVSNSNLDMTDSTLKDSNETIIEKPKKKVSGTARKAAPTGIKKKQTASGAADKTSPRSNSMKTRLAVPSGTPMSRSGSEKSARSSRSAANGVFDRLSGSTRSKSGLPSSSARTGSRESVRSLDSVASGSTLNDEKVKVKRSSLNSRPATKTGSANSSEKTTPGDKAIPRRVAKKTDEASGGSTLRRTGSIAGRPTSATVSRTKSQRTITKPSSLNSSEGGLADNRASFLKKMLEAKATVKASV